MKILKIWLETFIYKTICFIFLMILLKKAMNENTLIHDDVIFLQSFKVKSLQFFFEIFLFEIFDKKKFFFDLTSFFR